MKQKKSGVIINVIGLAGERLRSDYIAGTTGNAALMAFTRALGGESVDYGVRVVGVNPGQIETPRLRNALEVQAERKLGDRSKWMQMVNKPPLGRLGRPEEIADVVAFLASRRASFVSGTIVTVDAGRSSRNVD
jgi:NAD(P)-dependent dehydrogenase (short-subunit alcohol dehydrogenase family)